MKAASASTAAARLHETEWPAPGADCRILLALYRETSEIADRLAPMPDEAMDVLLDAETNFIKQLISAPIECEADAAAKFHLIGDMIDCPAGEFTIEADAFQTICEQFVAWRNSQHMQDCGRRHPRYGAMA